MKTSQEIAESLAVQTSMAWMANENQGIAEVILREIPLAQLVEVAKAAAPILEGLDYADIESYRNSHKGNAAMEISFGDVVAIYDALSRLKQTGKAEWL